MVSGAGMNGRRSGALDNAHELMARVGSCNPNEIRALLDACIDLVQSDEDVVGGFMCLRYLFVQVAGGPAMSMDDFDESLQSRLCAIFWTFLPADRKTQSAMARDALEAVLDLFEYLSTYASSSSGGTPFSSGKGPTGKSSSKKGLRPPPQPAPVFLSMLTSQALQVIDRKVSLIVLEALSQRYGIQYISSREPDLYYHLVHGSESNQEVGLSRRSKLAIAHLRHEGQMLGLFSPDGKPFPESEEQRLRWAAIWTETVASTMVASGAGSRRRAHLCNFHLPSLFDLAPWSLIPLIKALMEKRMSNQDALAGLLSVLRCAKLKALAFVGQDGEGAIALDDIPLRQQDLCQKHTVAIPLSLVETCVSSSIQELQVLGLSLVTDARTSSTSLSSDDFRIVRDFLRTNFSQSTPESRNAIHSILGRLMARLKASTHAASRKGKEAPSVLSDAKAFLEWLRDSASRSLHPGAPYHIARAALSYLEMLAFSGIDPNISRANLPKRSAGQPVDDLHFPFTVTVATANVVDRLLQCADSTYLELQLTAFRLLLRFPAPLTGLEDREKAQNAVLKKSLRLMVSTREAESHAASLLARLYLDNCVNRCGWSWSPFVLFADDQERAPEHDREGKDGDMTLHFIDDMLGFLDFLLEQQQNRGILYAARSRPIHGTMVALQELFRGIKLNDCDPEHLRKVLIRTMELIDRAWVVTRSILCHSAPEGSTASGGEHNEMRQALEAAQINGNENSDDDGNEDDDDRISLVSEGGNEAFEESTPRHQIILSYCWRGMKEASALLGTIVASTLDQRIWTEAQVRSVGQRFNLWLSLVRHRGAFSTIYPSYQMAASALIQSNWPEVKKLPTEWLKEFIDGVASPQASISTTRRSAGIGFAVLALICATTSRSERETVGLTVKRLVNVAKSADEVTARIHALNILRVLVSDTSLAEALQPFEGELLILVIPSFTSPTWRIRNAAMMLFSQLCNRIFTYNLSNRENFESKKSWHEFFSKYDGLLSMLREHIEKEACTTSTTKPGATDAYQSSVFAVLLLLSRLQARDTAFFRKDLDPALLSPLIEKCLGSYLWKLREIAASAYVATILPQQALETAAKLIIRCSQEGQNRKHGSLLAAQKLVVLARQHDSSIAANVLPAILAERAHSYLQENPCATTRAAFLDLVEELGGAGREAVSIRYCNSMLDETREMDSVTLRNRLFLPGEVLSMAACARAVLRAGEAKEAELLRHPVSDVRREAIKHIVKNQYRESDVQSILLDMIIEPSEGIIMRIEAAKALSRGGDDKGSASLHAEEASPSRLERLTQVALQGRSIPLKEAAMPVLAALLPRVKSVAAVDEQRLGTICEDIADRAKEEKSYESRRSAIDTIDKMYDLIFARQESDNEEDRVKRGLFDARLAFLKLVVDDDEDIRESAIAIAGKIGQSALQKDAGQGTSITTFAKQCPPSCVASVERMWTWMEEQYDVDDSSKSSNLWREHVWSLLCPSEEQRRASLSRAFERSTALFAEEQPNQFVDPEAQLVAAHAYCLRHPLTSSSTATRMLQAVSEDAEALLVHVQDQDKIGAVATPRSAFTTYQLAMRLSLAMDALDKSSLSGIFERQKSHVAGQRQALDRMWKSKEEASDVGQPSNITREVQSQTIGEDNSHAQADGQQKLHIAMVSDFFFPNVGGVEGHIHMLSQRLLERGHKVIVITHAYPPHRTGVRYLSGGLKVYYVPYQVIARQDTLPNFFSLLPLLRQILVRESINLVHAHQALSSMGLESLLHAKSMGLKTVFTDHSLFGFGDAASILTNKLLRFLLSDVDAVVCVSHTAKENTTLRANLDPCKVSVIPNAVESDSFRPRTPTLVHEDPRQVTIVVLSRLMYRKGIDLLLACIPRLCAMDPHIRFIIGGDGPKRVELEQMREQFSSLHARVEVCGAIRAGSQVRNHLIKGHIFLNTSLTEAFGTGIVEAASCGLLVVSTRVGGIPEVLPEWMNLLAEPDEDEIVEATLRAVRLVRLRLQRSGMVDREDGDMTILPEPRPSAEKGGKAVASKEEQEVVVAPDPWHQHTRLSQMYSWSNTAKRVERVYLQAMEKPMPSTVERLTEFRRGGPIAGIIFVIVVSVEMLFLVVLNHLSPSDDIEVLDASYEEAESSTSQP